MAKSGERRMLFDIRGRRRHVIRVVYGILAVLMGASLFLVVGPLNITDLIGGGGSSRSTSSIFEEQAQQIERRLAKRPGDTALLVSLTRARLGLGQALSERNPETGAENVTAPARAAYEEGFAVWQRYSKRVGGKASPILAEAVARASSSVAFVSTGPAEAEQNLKRAAAAQQLAAKQRPTVHSLSLLAYYDYLAGAFAAGDAAIKQAQAKAPSKTAAKNVKTQLAPYRKEGKSIQKQLRSYAKLEREKGKEALQNPFGGLGGGSGLP